MPDPATHKCLLRTCDYSQVGHGRIVCRPGFGGCGRVWTLDSPPGGGPRRWVPDPPPIGAARSPRRDRP